MSPDSNTSFLQRIRKELNQMHPAERRLADFLLSFPGELASYTASELARLANVSNATVSRFVQRLGYANYDEARRHVRSNQMSGAALYRVVSSSDLPEQILNAHAQQAHANIERTFASIPLQEIDEAAGNMLSARRVWVIGFRTSQSFATYLQWQVLQVIDSAVSLPSSGHTMAEHVASMKDEDCVIVFGLRRRIRGFAILLEQIVNTGARTMLITDDSCERMDAVTWHFRCQTAAAGPLYNHVAVMALVDLLATRVIDLAGEKRRRLSLIETLHEIMDEI